MKNKIKYNPFKYPVTEKDLKRYRKVKNPTSYENLPDGEYLIRGYWKNHYIEYKVLNKKWHKVSVNNEKDNSFSIAATYCLFPSLPESEWIVLNKHFKKLSPYWKKCVMAKNLYMRLREISRDITKSMIRFEKFY